MQRALRGLMLVVRCAILLRLSAYAQKIKFIVEKDAPGPGTSDQQAILGFLQSEKFDVPGITTVSGDQWVKEDADRLEVLVGKR
jgi:hypothetical protein